MAWQSFVTATDVFDRLKVGADDRLSQLLSLSPGQEPLESIALQQAVAFANDEIRSLVLARYPQPFETIPATLTDIGTRLVVWRLKGRRPETVTELDERDYDDAMKALREIAKGERTLVFPPVNQTEALVPPRHVALNDVGNAAREDFDRVLRAF